MMATKRDDVRAVSTRRTAKGKAVTGVQAITASNQTLRLAGRIRDVGAATSGTTQSRTALDLDLDGVRADAVRRRALERLSRIDERRDAVTLSLAGHGQREIAEILATTQPRVHRMLRAAENAPETPQNGGAGGTTPEEVILRATVDGWAREDLVGRLSEMEFTYRTYAPGPLDGALPGTWDQVEAAQVEGLLTAGEFEQIRDATNAPS